MSANLCEDLQTIVPLDFDSAKNVPESYVWLKSDDVDSPAGKETVPVVDLKEPEAAMLIGHACETWGVFQVTNHGVPLDLLEEVESEARKLFRLPLEQKLKVLRTSDGSAGYGVSRISQFFDKKMWFEGFTIKGSLALYDHAKSLWPNDDPRFCDVMEECEQRMKELATSLMCVFLKSLEVTDDKMSSILSPGRNNAGSALQLNSYPPCPTPDRVMGLAPHTDTSLFTVLYQGNIGGLHVFKEGLGWVLVKPLPGALVVNIGDLLHILSNARFHSVVHRVAMKEAKHRISIAFFHSPSDDFPLSPLVRDGEVPVYRSVMAKEYVDIKFEGKDPEKAFSVIKTYK